jgi:hypothetical protein
VAHRCWRHSLLTRAIDRSFVNLPRQTRDEHDNSCKTQTCSAGNMFAEYGPGTLTDFLDLQGLSHPPLSEITGANERKSGHRFCSRCVSRFVQMRPAHKIRHARRCVRAGSHADNLATRRPQITSECCSCQSQRGEDTGTASQHYVPAANATVSQRQYSEFNADCLQDVVNRSDSLPFVAGLFVWTLGEKMAFRFKVS